MGFIKIADRKIIDITARNKSEVPHKRYSNPSEHDYKIQFIVCHYLGVPNADNPDLYESDGTKGYGGHYNIERNGQIYKAADPKTAVVWQCGGGRQGSGGGSFFGICTNYNSIGIECGVCYTENVKNASGDSGKWYFTKETQESLIWLVSRLMDEYGISADHVIRHYDVTGKICPNPYVKNNNLRTSWTWTQFKNYLAEYRKSGGYTPGNVTPPEEEKFYRVRKSWADASSQIGAFTVLDNAKENCPAGYAVFDWNGKEVYRPKEDPGAGPKGIPVSKGAYIAACGAIARELMQKTRILASVVWAQCCLETGFGLGEDSVELMKVNNLLGMKTDLINSTWAEHSVWNGKEITKVTPEYDKHGNLIYITDHFRQYTDYRNCIEDYENFLLYVKNDKGYKYRRIKGMTDPAAVIHAIRIGTGTDANPEGYCTDPNYETKILKLIRDYNLRQYDGEMPQPQPDPAPVEEKFYRVRKSWEDIPSQKGAFTILENAKACADENPGYCVFDDQGKCVYESKAGVKAPFLVRVDREDLNIRTGPGTNHKRTQYIPKGIYTIVEVQDGKGSKAGWGKLKSGAGWISLDYAVKLV